MIECNRCKFWYEPNDGHVCGHTYYKRRGIPSLTTSQPKYWTSPAPAPRDDIPPDGQIKP